MTYVSQFFKVYPQAGAKQKVGRCMGLFKVLIIVFSADFVHILKGIIKEGYTHFGTDFPYVMLLLCEFSESICLYSMILVQNLTVANTESVVGGICQIFFTKRRRKSLIANWPHVSVESLFC